MAFMRVWRISNHSDLSGKGGQLAEGRWHDRGRLVVYLSEHPALALLELLVHLEIDVEDIPAGFRLLKVEVPGEVSVEEITEGELESRTPDWRLAPDLTRAPARPWFAARRTALLGVPSVIVPRVSNFLLNPLHSDAHQLTISSNTELLVDERLLMRRR